MVEAPEGIRSMHDEVILIVACAVIVVCFWRAALAILVSTTMGVLLLGLITALRCFLH